jgi:hypothetical protein
LYNLFAYKNRMLKLINFEINKIEIVSLELKKNHDQLEYIRILTLVLLRLL